MKRHAVIVAIHAEHSDLEISQFFNVTRSFVDKVRRELEASYCNMESFANCRKHKPHSVRTPQFVEQAQEIIDEDPSKSIRVISGDLQVFECTILHNDHEDIRYKPYVMHRGQFTSAKTREQRFIRGKRFLNKVKHPEIPDMRWFYSEEKILSRIKD